MRWLDNVLATPIIGLRVEPDFVRAPGYPAALGPLLNRLLQEQGEIKIETAQPLSLVFRSTDGFLHKVLSTDVIVEFNYPLSAQTKPGELPTLERREVESYSKLLEQTEARMKDVVGHIAAQEPLAVRRVGIVAAMRHKRDNLPPGVKALLEHLARPWGELLKSETSLLAKLAGQDAWRDQCHHTVVFDEASQPGSIQLTLDWQRVFTEAGKWRAPQIEEELRRSRGSALEYFERVGAGELAYE
ncbi:MAG: hypothetical protein HY721_03035 [Planctomycetes bacterium]|nr:hypothetical protein [Planctomycetota bacterium]